MLDDGVSTRDLTLLEALGARQTHETLRPAVFNQVVCHIEAWSDEDRSAQRRPGQAMRSGRFKSPYSSCRMIFTRGELASESLKAEPVEPKTSVAADRRSVKETMAGKEGRNGKRAVRQGRSWSAVWSEGSQSLHRAAALLSLKRSSSSRWAPLVGRGGGRLAERMRGLVARAGTRQRSSRLPPTRLLGGANLAEH
jgi:hypothetical protein